MAEVSPEMLFEGLLQKFSQCQKAKEKLISTGTAKLVYATTRDRVLGSGLEIDDIKNGNTESWEGLNELGIMLMDVRGVLQQDEKS